MKFISKSEKDTIKFAKKYAKKLKKGNVLYLIGELGAGKTQFVKGLAEGLGVEKNVSSPTFVYENIYEGKKGAKLYHFDLYRENTLDTDIKMMLLEAAEDKSGTTVVEWADRIQEDLPLSIQKINFIWKGENERIIDISE